MHVGGRAQTYLPWNDTWYPVGIILCIPLSRDDPPLPYTYLVYLLSVVPWCGHAMSDCYTDVSWCTLLHTSSYIPRLYYDTDMVEHEHLACLYKVLMCSVGVPVLIGSSMYRMDGWVAYRCPCVSLVS